jgi:hypothetical protein
MRLILTFSVATVLSICFSQLLVAQQTTPRPPAAPPLGAPPPTAVAPVRGVFYTELGHILNIETEGDTLYASLDVSFVNAEDSQNGGNVSPCGSSPRKELSYYALSIKESEVAKFNEAILLSAFISGKQVRFMLQGCIGVFPQILGISIGKPLS